MEKRIPLSEPQAKLMEEAGRNLDAAKRDLMNLFAMACAAADVENANLKMIEGKWMIVDVPDEIPQAESAA